MLRVTALFCMLLFCSVIDVIQCQSAVGTISPNPAEFGSTVTLNCIGTPASGDTGSIAWLKRLPLGLSILVTTNQVVSSEFSLIHVLYNVTARDSGDYICRFDSHLAGNHTDDVVTLEIIPAVDIIENPTTRGSNVTLYCIGGPAPEGSGSLFWLSPTPNVIASSGIVTDDTTLVHVLVNVDASVGGEYTCRFDSITRPNADNTMTLQIFPYFTDATTGTKVLQTNGSTFNVTCEAEGFPAPTMELLDLRSMPQIVATTASNSLTHMFVSFQFGQEGSYQCVATSAIQTIYHNFTIILSPGGTVTPDFIIAAPDSSGDFSCSALGGPGNQFVWVHNGTTALCSDCQQELTLQDIQGLINGTSSVVVSEGTSLNIASVNISVVGAYGCLVANDAGFDVEFVSLYMTPLIIEQPQSGIVKSDESFNLTCVAQSFPSPTYQWEKFNETTSQFEEVSPNGDNSILELNPVGSEGYGLYRCVASTLAEGIRNSTISNEARVAAPPSINPPNDTAKSGDIVMFNCSTNGGPSTFRWFKGDTEITTGSPYTIINETEELSTLKINIVTGEEYGNYTCVVTNIAGTAQATAELAVSPEDFITISMAPNVTLNRGDDITLTCNTTAGPNNIFTWVRQGNRACCPGGQPATVEELLNDTSLIISEDQTLVLTDVNASHGSSYTCLVINDAGFGVATTVVYIRPYFTQELNESIFVNHLDPVNLTCEVESFPASTIQWEKINSTGYFEELSGETNNNLIISSVGRDELGTYRCVATTSLLNIILISTTTIYVYPLVTLVPQNATTMSGETVQLNCSSEGGPNNQFKWFKDGSEIAFNGKFSINDGGNHLSSLYVNNIEGGDQGEYECLVNNTAGSSRAMTLLTVSPKNLVTVTPTPNITLDRGDDITLICNTTAGPNNMFYWLKRGQYQACCPGGQLANVDELLNDTSLIVSQDQTLVLTNVNASHGSSYTCSVINDAGFGVASTIVYIRPYFIIEPEENVFVQVSTSVNLTCVAESFPEPSKYEWFKLMSGSFVKLEGENTTTLMFPSIDFSDFGTYRCEVTTDILGVTITSRESVLHVSPFPSVDIQPQNATTEKGESPMFNCSASGGPNNQFRWFKNETEIFSSDSKYDIRDEGNHLSILTINNIVGGEQGVYKCVVNNSAGDHMATTRLDVSPKDLVTVTPANNITLDRGDDHTLTCQTPAGSNNQFIWLHRSQEEACCQGGQPTNLTVLLSDPSLIVGREEAFELRNVNASHGGFYICVVINDASFGLASTTVYIRPYFIEQPAENIFAKNLDPVTLTCGAESFPEPTFQWEKINSSGYFQEISGETNSTLVFSSVGYDDFGNYQCVVRTSVLDITLISNTSTLHVSPEDSVRVEPSLQIIDHGSEINFTCTAQGGPDNIYLWFLNASNQVCTDCSTSPQDVNQFLMGLSNSSALNTSFVTERQLLTISDVNATLHGGTYFCVVLNDAGYDVGTGVLFVTVTFTQQPTDIKTTVNMNVEFTCEAQSFPHPSYSWERLMDGGFVSDERGNMTTLPFMPVSYSDAGVYRCVATSSNGSEVISTLGSDNATLYVSPEGSVQLINETLTKQGGTFSLECRAEGGPNNQHVWYHRGVAVVATSELTITSSSNDTHSVSILSVSNVDAATHKGDYTCNVTNMAGSESKTSTVVVSPEGIVSTLPINATQSRGDNVNFTCTTDAGPNNIYVWLRNISGIGCSDCDGGSFNESTDRNLVLGAAIAQTQVLALTDITAPTNGGTYYCVVLNDAGYGIDSSILFVVPYFITHPQNVELEQMQTLRLTCEAEAFPSPSIQWEKMNRVTGMFEAISGEISTVFMINSVNFSDFGMYRCVATNVIGGIEYNTNSSAAVVTISPEGSVIVQPKNMTFDYEDEVNLTCTCQGGPNNMFSWLFNGSTITSGTNSYTISSTEFSSILTISHISAPDHGGLYQCIKENIAGNGSDTTYVFISPRFIIQPVQTLAVNGMINNLTCEAESFPVPQYMWRKHEPDGSISDVGPDDYLLPFNPVVFGDAGIYQCIATSDSITIYSNNATLYVSPEGTVELINQTLTKQGGTFSLECRAKGGPNNQHVWYHRGELLADTSVLTITSSSNETDSVSILSVSSVDAATHKGDYTCNVTNMAGSESKTSTVVVSPEGIVSTLPINATHNRGDNVTFNCITDAGPGNVYVWLKNGSEIVCSDCSGRSFNGTINTDLVMRLAIAISENLTLTDITAPTDGGTYDCIVLNNAGFGIDFSILYVVPYFITHPQNVELEQMQTLRLTCEAEAFPSPSIQWEKMNRVTGMFEAISGENNTVFMINSVNFSDFGMYRCVATNVINGVEYNTNSSAALVTISPRGSVIVQPQNMTFDYEDEVNLTCTCQGGPNNMFSWLLNGSIITSGTNSYTISSTEFSSILTISRITAPDHGGLYQCTTQNNAGNGSDTTYVFISPRFLIQPIQTLSVNGMNSNLTCEAESFPVPQYMWRKHEQDGRTLDVGPDDYLLPFNPIVFGDAGIYQCIATSNSITIYSNNATLYVSPEGSVQLINETLTKQRGTFSLECRAEGGPNNQHLWYHRGMLLVDTSVLTITSSSNDTHSVSILSVNNVDAGTHRGDYTCNVTNMAGSESKTSTVVVSPEGIVSVSPMNATHSRDDNINITCTTDAGPNNMFTWSINGSNITSGTNSYTISSTEYYSILTISGIIAPDHGGLYQCIAQNNAGSGSDTTYVFISPRFLIQPIQTLAVNGMINNLTCEAESFPVPQYMWHKHEQDGGTLDVGPDDYLLPFNPIVFGDAGIYQCIATSNSITIYSNNATLYVSPEGSVQLISQTLTEQGSTFSLECRAEGGPNNQHVWYHRGVLLVDTSVLTITSSSNDTHSVSILSVNDVDAGTHRGDYTCNVTNMAGSESKTSTVVVSPKGIVTVSPMNATHSRDDNVNITCTTDAGPNNMFTWSFNGSNITSGTNSYTISSTEYYSILTISGITAPDHGGLYQCITQNNAGSGSDTTYVFISPRFIIQPIQTLSVNGMNNNLTCEAESFPVPQYMWRKHEQDGRTLDVGPDDYLLPFNPIVFGDAGIYQCIATSNSITIYSNNATLYVSPEGSVQLINETLTKQGGTFSLECRAEGGPNNQHVWYHRGVAVVATSELTITSSSNDTHSVSVLTRSNVNAVTHKGDYTCNVTNMAGSESKTSTVVVSPEGIVSTLPMNATHSRGDNVNFTCTTDAGPNNIYLWLRNISEIGCSECDGGSFNESIDRNLVLGAAIAQTQVVSLTDITAPTNGGTYYCVVLNDAGYGIDSSILFVVPYFITHPQNVELEQMQTLRLTCEAEAFPSPSIQWEKMNRVTGMFEAISGEISTVFMINTVAFSDFGMYRCVASNVINGVEYNATSLAALVTISPRGSVIVQPQNMTFKYEDEVNLTCTCQGGPNNMFSWLLNGSTITSGTNSYTISSTEFSSILTISRITAPDHGGLYQCIAQNIAGNGSDTTYVFISPRFLTHPVETTLSVRGMINNLTCEAESFPVPQYMWHKHEQDGRTLDVGPDDHFLPFNPIVFGDAGIYQCIATSNSITIYSNNATLYVSPEGSVQLISQTLTEQGGTFSLECRAEGGPNNQHVWYHRGVLLVDTSVLTITSSSNDTHSVSILNVSNVNAAIHKGDYTCNVTNMAGSESKTSTVVVSPERIVSISPMNATHSRDDNVNITCTTNAGPNNMFTWSINGSNITSGTNSYTISSTEYYSILTISGITAPDHGGLYQCIAQNNAGSGSDTTYVFISPRFIIQPIQTLAVNGMINNLTCEAESFPVPQYMWHKHEQDGGTLDVGPDDYLLPFNPIVFGDAGIYQCIATSNSITIYSNNATLYVSPEGSVQLISQTLTEQGSTFSLECRAEGGPNNQHVWYHRGVLLVDTSVLTITSSSNDTHSVSILSVNNVDAGTHRGDYTCNVTNMAGSESKTSTVVVSPKGIVTVSPMNATHSRDDNVNITCTTDAGPNNMFTWSINGSNITSGTNSYTISSTEYYSILTISGITAPDHGGLYQCITQNNAGSGSDTTYVFISPRFLIQPIQTLSVNGMNSNLTCEAESFPVPQYMWRKHEQDGKTLDVGPDDYLLPFNPIVFGDAGIYQCIATSNSITIYSNNATLYVSPEGSVQLISQTLTEQGSTFSLECRAKGGPNNQHVWYHRGVAVVATSELTTTSSSNDTHSVSVLTRSNVNAATHRGDYTCNVTNMAGSESKTSTVVVSPEGIVSVSPMNATHSRDDNVNITCRTDAGPNNMFTWSFNGSNITSGTNSYTISSTEYYSILTISGITAPDHGGLYQCIAQNNAGSGSDTTYVFISPRFIIQPIQTLSVNGMNSNLTCEAESFPVPQYMWHKHEQDGRTLDVGPDDYLLPFNPIVFGDAGIYQCIATSNSITIYSNNATLYVSPEGSVQLINETLAKQGGTFSLECRAEGGPNNQHVWYHRGVAVIATSELTITSSSNDTHSVSVLTRSNVNAATHKGDYTCNVTNMAGSESKTSTVVVSPEGIVSTLPMNATHSRGDNVNFTCITDAGPNNIYLWLRNISEIGCSECDGGSFNESIDRNLVLGAAIAQTQVVSLTDITAPTNGGTYYCVVLNDAGYGVDSSILFVVPYFITHPQNVELEQMQTLRLTCEAEAFPSPSIQWEKMNRVTGMFEAISGEISTIFMINSVNFSDFGMYQCVASNVINGVEYNATSSAALVTISPRGSVIVQPKNMTFDYEDEVNLTCTCQGGNNNMFSWLLNGSTITSGTNSYTISSTEFSSILTISRITAPDHGGLYQCIAQNIAGNGSDTTYVFISPRFLTHPVETTLSVRGMIKNLTCEAESFPVPQYMWHKHEQDGRTLDVGPDDHFLPFNPIVFGDAGIYQCIATSNSITIYSNNATLYVSPEGSVQLISQTQTEQGSTFSLKCRAEGGPNNQHVWYHRGVLLVDTSVLTITSSSNSTHSVSTLSVNNVDAGTHKGVYTCNVTNMAGSESKTSTVVVSPEGIVSVSPMNATHSRDDNVNITCTTDAGPNNMFTWSFNGSNITSGTNSYTISSTEYYSILTISGITAPDHGGLYQCIAQNNAGSGSDTTYVFISPRFLIQPVQTLSVNGMNNNLTCEAESFPVPQYMWRRHEQDGRTLDVGPDDYLLPFNPIVFGDAGIYQCIATSNSITIYSNNATLYVSPEGSVQLISQTLTEQGSTLSLECRAEGGPNNQHVWYHRGVLLVDTSVLTITSSSNDTHSVSILSVNNVDAGMHRGDYTCNVTNMAGSESKTSTVVVSPKGIVTVSPMNATHSRDDNVNITCTTDAGPNNMFTWSFNGSNITSGTNSYTISSTEYYSILTISGITAPDHGGLYQCIAQNNAGSGSDTTYVFISPRFIIQPIQTLSVNGMNNNLTCEAESFPVPQYMWRKHEQDGRTLDVGPDDYLLPFNPIVFGDAGIYQCIATSNSITIYSNNATLYVSPEGSVQLINETLTKQGGTFSLECRAEGGPNNQHVWYHRGVAVVTTSELTITSSSNDTHSISVLTRSNVNAATHKGDYTCNVTNMAGSESKTSTVVVSPEGIVSTLPMNATHSRGDNVNFTCTTDAGPNNIYVWLRNISEIGCSECDGGSFNESIDRNLVLGAAIAQTQDLALTDITAPTNGGTYYCVVLNDAGYGIDSSILFVVPYFITHPQNVELEQMQTLRLTCEAEAFPSPSIQWEKMNRVTGMFEAISGEISTVFMINTVAFSDFGMYRCVATNVINGVEYNATTSAALVTISPRGSVIVQPKNMTFDYEDEVNLTCTCQGGPNNMFSWLFNGSSITSGTNSYTISSTEFSSILTISRITAPDHGGLYQCIKENIAGNGSDTTYVFISPRFLTHPVETTLSVRGMINNLTCEAESFPVPQYMWRKHEQDGRTLDVGPDDYLLPFNPIVFGNAGIYQCIATSNSITIYSNNATLYVSPEGSVQLINQTLTKQGSTFSLKCRAEGGPNNQHVWYHRGMLLVDTSVLTITSFSNDTDSLSILSISNVDAGTHKGDYTCNVTNMAGSESKTSTVVVSPEGIVSTLPINATHSRGDNVNFTCTTDAGPNNIYVWLRNISGIGCSECDGGSFNESIDRNLVLGAAIAQTQVVSLTDITAPTNGGTYYCVVLNDAGYGIDSSILFVVPYFITHPQNVELEQMQTLRLTCEAEAFPSPSIQWEKMNRVTGMFEAISGEISTVFMINTVAFSDFGMYQCVASNVINGVEYNATSLAALVTISPRGSVIVQPKNMTFNYEDEVNLTCTCQGGPNNMFSWLFNGSSITSGTNSYTISSTEFSSILTISRITAPDHGGLYQCIKENIAGNGSDTTYVFISPRFLTHPVETTLSVRGMINNLTCEAESFPVPQYMWRKREQDGRTLDVGPDDYLLPFNPIVFGDAGIYQCIATSNSITIYSNNATLYVSPEGSVTATPDVINSLTDTEVTYNCTAKGGLFNNFIWTYERTGNVVANGQLLTFDSHASKGGDYQCLVTNLAGMEAVNVTLNVGPEILIHPSPMNVSIMVENITLHCLASGFPIPNITWLLNNSMIEADNDRITVMTTDSPDLIPFGTVSSVLTIERTVIADSGNYQCVANNLDFFSKKESQHALVLVQAVPDEPLNLTARNVTSRNLILEWIRPHHNNAPILGYYIFYTRPDFLGGDIVTLLVTGAIEQQFIDELHPGEMYSFTAIAFNEEGNSSNVSLPLTVRTLEEAPGGPPVNVTGFANSSVSIQLMWELPNKADRHGVIIGYDVRYVGNNIELFLENVTDLSVLLINLEEFENYNISVHAKTAVGPGPWSEAIVIMTDPHIPGPVPQPFPVTIVTSTSAILQWNSTSDPNGNDLNYTVIVTPIDTVNSSLSSRRRRQTNNIGAEVIRCLAFLKLNATVIVSTDGTVTITNVTGLVPFTVYEFVVIATNEFGSSPPSPSRRFSTLADNPSSVEDLILNGTTSNSIVISWISPSCPNSLLSGYRIYYKMGSTPQTGSINDTDYSTIDSTDASSVLSLFTIEGLTAGTIYLIHVRAFTERLNNNELLGDADTEIAVRLNPGPVEDLDGITQSLTSIIISWDPPPSSFIDGYIIYYREGTNRQTVPINSTTDYMSTRLTDSDLQSYTIEGLREGTTYLIHVRAFSEQFNTMLIGDADTEIAVATNTMIQIPPDQQPTSGISSIFFRLPSIGAIMNAIEIDNITYYGIIVVPDPDTNFNISVTNFDTQYPNIQPHVSRGNNRYYITAAWNDPDLVPDTFTVGDQSNTVAVRNGTAETYHNAKLRRKTPYCIYIVVHGQWNMSNETIIRYSEQVCIDTKLGYNLIALIVLLSFAFIVICCCCIACIIFIICCYRRRKEKEEDYSPTVFVPPQETKPEIIILNEYAEKGTDRDPVPVIDFVAYVERMHSNQDYPFSEEFRHIEPHHSPTRDASMANRERNRYVNIPAYDHSRVVLKRSPSGSDYINANHIEGYKNNGSFIATQGPMNNTVNDFWHMIWENEVPVIVMLTNLIENERVKCHQYWPQSAFEGSNVAEYGPLRVKLVEESKKNHQVLRTFTLSKAGSSEERIIKQYHFTSWPDYGAPSSPGPLLEFVDEVRSDYNPFEGPMVVHCSAGVGRTGTFMAILVQLARIQSERTVDIYNYVRYMRTQRPMMVMNEEEYIFIHDALVEALTEGMIEGVAVGKGTFDHEEDTAAGKVEDGVTIENDSALRKQREIEALVNEYGDDDD